MTTTKTAVSPARQRLIELCQRLDFGRIEHLSIRYREPVFDPAPAIVAEVKLDAQRGRNATCSADFALKPQVLELLRWFDLIEHGRIRVLDVRHGLPFRIEFDGLAA